MRTIEAADKIVVLDGGKVAESGTHNELAADLNEFWELARQFDRSLYREWKDHWDERGYDEYIVVTEGRLPYCETPEQYVYRMETRREILSVLALCTEKQRERFLLHMVLAIPLRVR